MLNPLSPYILLPSQQYTQMKTLLNSLSQTIQKFASSTDRSILKQAILIYQEQSQQLQKLCLEISQQFQDAKINKKTLQTQIESLQINLREIRETGHQKQQQSIKYSSQLLKISQQNEKLKDYIRKIKEQNRNYKIQMEELVQALSGKVKRYKVQFEEKVQGYEAKIRVLEARLKESDRVGKDLDKELEELARLEAEVGQGEEEEGQGRGP